MNTDTIKGRCTAAALYCYMVRDLFFLEMFIDWRCFRCRARLWRFSIFIAVQIMRDAVAVSAFRELGQHLCRVWRTVTTFALGYHLVLCLMTGHATQVLVLEGTGRKQCVGFLVTGGTVLGRRFVIVDNVLRHVCLVTFFTIGIGLFHGVSFVTLGAIRNLAVGIVTRAAEKRGMLAFVFAQLDYLRGMAGQTGIGDGSAKFYIQRRMRVNVAAVAGRQLIMRFSFVALAAERDDLPSCGRVPIVTILTADLRLVLGACRSYIGRSLAVTFDAIIIQ